MADYNINERVATLEANFEAVRESLFRIENRLDKLDSKIDSAFKWMFTTTVGIVIGGMIVITAMLKLL